MFEQKQIEMLSEFILNNCPEEIGRDGGGAGEVAIEIIKKYLEAKKIMNDLLVVQSFNGNWNYDEYELGMYNATELMLSIIENRDPNYRQKPKKWIKDEY